MISSRTAVLILALVPAAAIAQRGGGMRGGGRTGGQDQSNRGSGGGVAALQLSNGDVEEMSPIKRLIDKRKDLTLSDAQVKQFKNLESEMKTRNETLFKQLDSLRNDMSVTGRLTDEQRNRALSARQSVVDVVASIRLSYNETLKQATPLLDDTQKTKADELVQQLNDAAETTLQEKLEGRGGRGSGDGSGGGRRGRPPI